MYCISPSISVLLISSTLTGNNNLHLFNSTSNTIFCLLRGIDIFSRMALTEDSDRPLNILIFSGRTPQNIPTLAVLKELLKIEKSGCNDSRDCIYGSSARPCEVFDLIVGGPDTGTWFAVLFGRFQLTIPDCLNALNKVMEMIRGKKSIEEIVKCCQELCGDSGDDLTVPEEPRGQEASFEGAKVRCKNIVAVIKPRLVKRLFGEPFEVIRSYRNPSAESGIIKKHTILDALSNAAALLPSEKADMLNIAAKEAMSIFDSNRRVSTIVHFENGVDDPQKLVNFDLHDGRMPEPQHILEALGRPKIITITPPQFGHGKFKSFTPGDSDKLQEWLETKEFNEPVEAVRAMLMLYGPSWK